MAWGEWFILGWLVLVFILVVVFVMRDGPGLRTPAADEMRLVSTGVEYVDMDGNLQKKKVALANLVGIPECTVMTNKHVIAPSELDLAAYMIASGGFEVNRGPHTEHGMFAGLNLPPMENGDIRTLEMTRDGNSIAAPYGHSIGVETNEITM